MMSLAAGPSGLSTRLTRPGGANRVRAALIESSFALAAERCGDLTPLVYARLFREQPQLEPLFCMDANGLVRGEMLSQVILAILDFVGERQYAATLIQSEAMNHAGYEVPAEVFGTFFCVLADTLREVLGDEWTAEIDMAWRDLLIALAEYVTHTD